MKKNVYTSAVSSFLRGLRSLNMFLDFETFTTPMDIKYEPLGVVRPIFPEDCIETRYSDNDDGDIVIVIHLNKVIFVSSKLSCKFKTDFGGKAKNNAYTIILVNNYENEKKATEIKLNLLSNRCEVFNYSRDGVGPTLIKNIKNIKEELYKAFRWNIWSAYDKPKYLKKL